MKKFAPLIVCLSLLFVAHLSATETEPESTPTSAVPQFKAGDKVYLSISGNVLRMVVYLAATGKEEFKNPDKYDYSKGEFLIPYDDKVDVRIWTRSGTKRDAVRINAKELLDNIAKNIKKDPENKQQWQWQWKEGEETVNFKFAAIQRFFRLESIEVPPSSTYRNSTVYSGGHLPLLRLRVVIDGKERTCIDTGSNNKGWSAPFSQYSANRFELREGGEEILTLYLKDRNTTWPSRENNLADFPNIRFDDIQSGTIVETLAPLDPKVNAIKLYFQKTK